MCINVNTSKRREAHPNGIFPVYQLLPAAAGSPPTCLPAEHAAPAVLVRPRLYWCRPAICWDHWDVRAAYICTSVWINAPSLPQNVSVYHPLTFEESARGRGKTCTQHRPVWSGARPGPSKTAQTQPERRRGDGICLFRTRGLFVLGNGSISLVHNCEKRGRRLDKNPRDPPPPSILYAASSE